MLLLHVPDDYPLQVETSDEGRHYSTTARCGGNPAKHGSAIVARIRLWYCFADGFDSLGRAHNRCAASFFGQVAVGEDKSGI